MDLRFTTEFSKVSSLAFVHFCIFRLLAVESLYIQYSWQISPFSNFFQNRRLCSVQSDNSLVRAV